MSFNLRYSPNVNKNRTTLVSICVNLCHQMENTLCHLGLSIFSLSANLTAAKQKHGSEIEENV